MRKQSEYLNRWGERAATLTLRFLPDPWIYAVVLSLVAYVAAVFLTPTSPWRAAIAWQEGLWNPSILILIAQFSINLMLCTALARAPLVKKALALAARRPRTPSGAIRVIALVSIGLSLISWSLAIIGGALFAREVCAQLQGRHQKVHYPLAVAAGFVGMLTWGCGLTSSAVLISATPGHIMESQIGLIPVTKTLGSPTNLTILALLIVCCPLLLGGMHPREGIVELKTRDPRSLWKPKTAATFSEKLESSPWVLKAGALLPASYVVHYFLMTKGGFTIDSMNLIFLVAVLLVYWTPNQMLSQLSHSSRGVWPILFQFPFYAGLLGLVQGTGLVLVVAKGFIAAAGEQTWPVTGLVFQGLLNLFVPSGGAQWIISGPVLVETSRAFGYSASHAVLIEVMGDQLTNMIQPLWALPALALAGLEARDIMGYTAVVMLFAFLIMAICLTVLHA